MNKNNQAFDFSPRTIPLRRAIWFIFGGAILVLLMFSGKSALSGSEGDLAEGLRRMFHGEDIFSPECWWHPEKCSQLWLCRFRIYPFWIFGPGEFACRFPSAIAALAVLGGTMLLARDFFNRKVEYCTAWMLIGSYGFIYWGRFAGSYMALTAWCIWSVICLRNAKDHFWWRGIFFILVFSGSVWWGCHYIFLLPGMWLITRESCTKALFSWHSLYAMLFSAIVVSALLIFALYWQSVTFGECLGRVWQMLRCSWMETCRQTIWPGSGAWYKSLLNLPVLLLPWTLPATVALVWMIRKWHDLSDDHRNLLAGTLLMVVMTGIFPGRKWQFQLMQLPFILMICGNGIAGDDVNEAWMSKVNVVMKWLFAVLCSLAASVILTWPLWGMLVAANPPLWIMFGVPLLGIAGLLFLIFDTGSFSSVERVSGMDGVWSGYILAGVCFMTAVLTVALPALSDFRAGRSFWMECGGAARNRPASELLFYGGYPDGKALYYMDLPSCTVIGNGDGFAGALNNIPSGDALLVIRKRQLDEVTGILSALHWSIGQKPLSKEFSDVNFSAAPERIENKFILYRIFKNR